MQGADNYIPETNHVSRASSVSDILHLQFLLYVMIFTMINALHFYVSTSKVVPNMAVFCRSLMPYFPLMLFKYSPNDFEMVPIGLLLYHCFVFTILLLLLLLLYYYSD
jgi:hypothetical protein